MLSEELLKDEAQVFVMFASLKVETEAMIVDLPGCASFLMCFHMTLVIYRQKEKLSSP
jgi:hypothetical protein